ncbi:odorant receptor 13a-like isoform X1 [Vespa velutina]|uniref:odorant receptor 13a-like isoform X1 n=1 Tax=Vespa velutina TaxID=202808 RepID=UPI001FB49895|nr:odorant receptor 13a-like isoform X1 [Vespa velutina]
MQEVDFGSTLKALDLTEHAMRFVGTWPPKSFQPIFLFFLIYLTVHCTSAIIDIAVNISNMEYIISCLMENVFNVIALLKISICKIKRKSLAKFIDDIRSDFKLDNYYYDEEKMAFIHYNKCSRKFVIVLLVASFVASSMYYFFSLAMNIEIVLTNSSYGYRLPYRVWLLIEPTNVVTYVCLCFYQFLIIPTIVFGYIGTDCLFVSLVLHVSGLFSALSCEVKYVLNDTCDREKHLKQLIIKHVRLIRLSESLEEDFNLIILLQLIGTILQFCIVGYDALVRSADGDMAMLLSFLFIGSAVAGVLLVYCYIGECLIKESSILGDALYLCEWYNISKEEKKLMHICMLRSTKEMRLTSGKFFVLSLTTFTDVLKTSMAYFSVLRTFI